MIRKKFCAYVFVLLFLVCATSFIGCQGGQTGEPVAKVGRTVIDSASFAAFERALIFYPAPRPYYFHESLRPIATSMVEIEALYRYADAGRDANAKARSRAAREQIAKSLDFLWKQRFYTAILFSDLIADNLGFTDNELKAHYQQNKETFKVTVRGEIEGEDSTFVPPFDDVKRQVAEDLFYDKFPPDSEFLAGLAEHPHAHDSVMIRNYWIYNIRRNTPDFFMRKFFAEKFGTPLVDSERQLLNEENAPFNEDDLAVIRSWLPPTHRGMRTSELLEWLYRWKVFSERAQALGLTSKPEHKNIINWVTRIEYAVNHIEEVVLPTVDSTLSSSDTSLAALIALDRERLRFDGGNLSVSTLRLNAELDNIIRTRANVKIDSVMHDVRKRVGVTFMREDLQDFRSADYVSLFAEADTLKDDIINMNENYTPASVEEASRIFGILSANFAFTAEGRKAMNELAKIQLDMIEFNMRDIDRLFNSAIGLYRRAQILETDIESLCGYYFFAGLAYDEHLKNLPIAEANLKWILRHAQTCAFASDAEFMIQNLGEPLTSIEEIRGQSLRQGRKINFDEEL